MNEYSYIVTVRTDTPEHADEVMSERCNYDEDYGFDYQIGVSYPKIPNRRGTVEALGSG